MRVSRKKSNASRRNIQKAHLSRVRLREPRSAGRVRAARTLRSR